MEGRLYFGHSRHPREHPCQGKRHRIDGRDRQGQDLILHLDFAHGLPVFISRRQQVIKQIRLTARFS